MRVLVLSHRDIASELGHLEPWLEGLATGGLVRAYREDGPPSPARLAVDLLVVLGSPGSVATGHCPAPARAEIDMVRWWTASNRPYLGICFGAQVLACAAGGSVQRLSSTYRAYTSLPLEPGAREDLAGPWVLWHEDAIASPAGATRLARLPHADVAFRLGRAWGLQPHIEVTSESMARMLAGLGVHEAVAGEVLAPMRIAEASDDPPARRVARFLESYAESALGSQR